MSNITFNQGGYIKQSSTGVSDGMLFFNPQNRSISVDGDERTYFNDIFVNDNQQMNKVFDDRNLIPFPYYQMSGGYGGVRLTTNNSRTVYANGTCESYGHINITAQATNMKLAKGTYLLSDGLPINDTTNDMHIVVRYRDTSQTTGYRVFAQTQRGSHRVQFTVNDYDINMLQNTYVEIRVFTNTVGHVYDNEWVTPILTSYANYTQSSDYIYSHKVQIDPNSQLYYSTTDANNIIGVKNVSGGYISNMLKQLNDGITYEATFTSSSQIITQYGNQYVRKQYTFNFPTNLPKDKTIKMLMIFVYSTAKDNNVDVGVYTNFFSCNDTVILNVDKQADMTYNLEYTTTLNGDKNVYKAFWV